MIVRTVWANLLIQAITFATSILVARILGPEGRGELALVLLYPQLIAGIGLFGVDRAVGVLGGRGGFTQPLAMIVKLVLLLSVPVMVVGYATVSWRVADSHLAQLATLYLAYVPPVYFFTLAVFLFNGTGAFARFNLVRLGFYWVNLALLAVIWAFAPPMPLEWVVLANLASVYAGLALAAWLLRNFRRPEDGGGAMADEAKVSDVLRLASAFAFPIALTSLSSSAYQIVLEDRMGVQALGLFVVYFSYSRLLSPVGNAISAHVFHLGVSGEKRDIARIFRQSLVVYLVCAVPLWLIADWLVPLVFGGGFELASEATAFLFISCIFGLSANTLAEFMNGRQRISADIWGLTGYLTALGALGWWLVLTLELFGMALAMAIADFLRCGYLVVRVGQETERPAGQFWRVTRFDLAKLIEAGEGIFKRLYIWRR